MFTQKFIKIFHSVQEIGLFTLIQNLSLGIVSANPKWHLPISWATSCQYHCVCKILSKYSKRFKSLKFIIFRIWTSAKPRPIPNVIWLSYGLHHVNINVYAKFHYDIPFSSRDRAIFSFSEFGVRQSLNRWKMSFPNLLGQIFLISMFTQKFIKIFHSVQEIGLFTLIQNLSLGIVSANPKWHLPISWATSCQYHCVCKILSKYSKRFKSLKFIIFRIWTSAKPRPIPNVIWLSYGLHHVNINVYAKFHYDIPFSSRDRAIFSFSEFGVRQSLNRWKMSFPNLLGQIFLIAMFTQKFIKIFHSV